MDALVFSHSFTFPATISSICIGQPKSTTSTFLVFLCCRYTAVVREEIGFFDKIGDSRSLTVGRCTLGVGRRSLGVGQRVGMLVVCRIC